MNEFPMEYDTVILVPSALDVEQASELIRDKRVLVLDEPLWAGSATSVCVQNIQGYGPSELCVMTSELR